MCCTAVCTLICTSVYTIFQKFEIIHSVKEKKKSFYLIKKSQMIIYPTEKKFVCENFSSDIFKQLNAPIEAILNFLYTQSLRKYAGSFGKINIDFYRDGILHIYGKFKRANIRITHSMQKYLNMQSIKLVTKSKWFECTRVF